MGSASSQPANGLEAGSPVGSEMGVGSDRSSQARDEAASAFLDAGDAPSTEPASPYGPTKALPSPQTQNQASNRKRQRSASVGEDEAAEPKKKRKKKKKKKSKEADKSKPARGKPRDPSQLVREGTIEQQHGPQVEDGVVDETLVVEQRGEGPAGELPAATPTSEPKKKKSKKRKTADDAALEIAERLLGSSDAQVKEEKLGVSVTEAANRGMKRKRRQQNTAGRPESTSAAGPEYKPAEVASNQENSVSDLEEESASKSEGKKRKKAKKAKKARRESGSPGDEEAHSVEDAEAEHKMHPDELSGSAAASEDDAKAAELVVEESGSDNQEDEPQDVKYALQMEDKTASQLVDDEITFQQVEDETASQQTDIDTAENSMQQQEPTPPSSPYSPELSSESTGSSESARSPAMPVAEPLPDVEHRLSDLPAPRDNATVSRVTNREYGSPKNNDDDDDDHVDGQPDVAQATAEKATIHVKPKLSNRQKPNIGRAERINLPRPVVHGPSAGQFTSEEQEAVDAVFDYTLQQGDFANVDDMICTVCDWRRAGSFKLEAEAALPNRTKVAVRRFCQRRYHMCKTGPWTQEDDDVLRRAHALHPGKWGEISEMTDRRPEDCRDRWKNHVQYGSKLDSGPWSANEEAKLMEAVEEGIAMIREKALTDDSLEYPTDRPGLENMVDWTVVSKKMQGKRSAKRCRDKWAVLKVHGLTDGSTAAGAQPVSTEAEVAFDETSKKQRLRQNKFRLFQQGDYYDVLTEIHTAVQDHTKVFRDDSTFWSIVATKHPDSRFDGPLRRKTYYEALKLDVGEKTKRAPTIAAKALAMTKSMARWARKEGKTVDDLVRGFKPGKTRRDREEAKRRKQVGKAQDTKDGTTNNDNDDTGHERSVQERRPKANKAQKSAEYVFDSDAEDVEAGADEGSNVAAKDGDATMVDNADGDNRRRASQHGARAISRAHPSPEPTQASGELVDDIIMSSENGDWTNSPDSSVAHGTARLLWPSAEARRRSQQHRVGRR